MKIEENEIVEINKFLQKYTQDLVKPMYGVRDKNSLDSIIQSLAQEVFGKELYPTVFDKAAHLWYTLANYHCFYNGNKRTALVITYIFLLINGFQLAIDKSFYDFSFEIIEADLSKEEIKRFIKEKAVANTVPLYTGDIRELLEAAFEENSQFKEVIMELSLT